MMDSVFHYLMKIIICYALRVKLKISLNTKIDDEMILEIISNIRQIN